MTRHITFLARDSERLHRRILGALLNQEQGNVRSKYSIPETKAVRYTEHLGHVDIMVLHEPLRSRLQLSRKGLGNLIIPPPYKTM